MLSAQAQHAAPFIRVAGNLQVQLPGDDGCRCADVDYWCGRKVLGSASHRRIAWGSGRKDHDSASLCRHLSWVSRGRKVQDFLSPLHARTERTRFHPGCHLSFFNFRRINSNDVFVELFGLRHTPRLGVDWFVGQNEHCGACPGIACHFLRSCMILPDVLAIGSWHNTFPIVVYVTFLTELSPEIPGRVLSGALLCRDSRVVGSIAPKRVITI